MSLFGTVTNLFGQGSNLTGATTATGGKTSGAVGGIVSGLTSLAGPLSGILNNVLGQLDLDRNIANVLKYGLSSWGASATPEEMKKRFGEITYPWLKRMFEQTTMQNIGQQLTAIDYRLRLNAQQFKGLRDNHSKAKSTRLANDWAYQECLKLLRESVSKISQLLSTNGVKVVKRVVRPGEGQSWVSFWDESKVYDFPTRYAKTAYVYEVDQASLQAYQERKRKVAEGGNEKKSSEGGMNLGLLGAIAFGAFKLLK